MRHYNMVENCLSFDMRHFLINENKSKNYTLQQHYISLYKKIKTWWVWSLLYEMFQIRIQNESRFNGVCRSRSSWPKWSQKIGQKQRNFLFVELSEGLEASPKSTKMNIFFEI